MLITLFHDYLKLINDSTPSKLVEHSTDCSISHSSSLQLDYMGFEGVVVVVIMSVIYSMLLLLVFLLIRNVWNFGCVALVHESYGSLNTYKMPHAVNKEPDKGCCSWIPSVFNVCYRSIYERCGDDAQHYLSFQRHMIYFLVFASIISLCVLIPLNVNGATKESGYFQKATMINIQERDDFLWLHAIFGVILSACMVCFMRKHSLSIHYKDEEKVKYTIFINGLPRNADEEVIKKHFSEAYPTCKVISIHLCKDVSKLMKINSKWRKAGNNLVYYTNLFQKTGQEASIKPNPFSCLCCCATPGCVPRDSVQYYQCMKNKLQKEYKVELKAACQSHIGMAHVTFSEKPMVNLILKDFNTIVCHTKSQSSVSDELKTSRWSVTGAHYPENILWANMSVRGFKWWARVFCINILLFVLLLYLTTPEMIVSSLDKWKINPFYYMNKGLKYFPMLQLWIFSTALQFIVYYSTLYEAHWFKSMENKMMLYKMFSYLIFIILISPSLGLRSLYDFLLWMFASSQDLISVNRLKCLLWPHQGAVVVHYVIISAFVGNAMDMLRISEFLMYIIRMTVVKSTADRLHIMQTQAKEFEYGEEYARILCIITVVMAYSNISPLIVPCGLLFMLTRHATDLNNLYYVHLPSKQDRGLHEAAVKLSMVAPIFCLMWLFFFCIMRRGWMPLTILFGVLVLITIMAFLIKAVYDLVSHLCKSSSEIEKPYPESQKSRSKEHVFHQSLVYDPCVVMNIEMEAER